MTEFAWYSPELDMIVVQTVCLTTGKMQFLWRDGFHYDLITNCIRPEYANFCWLPLGPV